MARTERIEDGVKIIEHRDDQGKLHNTEGPALENGKTKTFAVHGNIMGESMFNAWKIACQAAGIELPPTHPGIAEEANRKLNQGASMAIGDTSRPPVTVEMVSYDRVKVPPVPFAFDPVAPLSANIDRAISETGRVSLSHTWESFFHEDRSFEATDRKLAIAEMIEFEMQKCIPFFFMNETRNDARKMAARVEYSMDTTPARKIDVSFSLPAFLHLPDKNPEQELKDLSELFKILESSYERQPGVQSQFSIINNRRTGEFKFNDLVHQDIKDKVAILFEKSEALQEWMKNINTTLNKIGPDVWIKFNAESVMGTGFSQEQSLTKKSDGGSIESPSM